MQTYTIANKQTQKSTKAKIQLLKLLILQIMVTSLADPCDVTITILHVHNEVQYNKLTYNIEYDAIWENVSIANVTKPRCLVLGQIVQPVQYLGSPSANKNKKWKNGDTQVMQKIQNCSTPPSAAGVRLVSCDAHSSQIFEDNDPKQDICPALILSWILVEDQNVLFFCCLAVSVNISLGHRGWWYQ